MLDLTKYSKFRLSSLFDTSILYPVVVLDWDAENDIPNEKSIFLSTTKTEFNVNNSVVMFKDRDLNITGMNESIDVINRKFKVSDVTIKVNNFPENLSVRMTDRFFNNNLVNKLVKVFWASDSISSLEECLPVFIGVAKSINFDDKNLTIKVEDYSQKKVTKDIPIARISDESNAITDEDYLAPIPFTYGEVNYAPVRKFINPNEPDKIYLLADDDEELTNTERLFGSHLCEGIGTFAPFRPYEPALFINKGDYCFVPELYETVGDQGTAGQSDGNLGAHTNFIQWEPKYTISPQGLYQTSSSRTGNIGHLLKSTNDTTGVFDNSIGWNEIQGWHIRFPYSFRLLDKGFSTASFSTQYYGADEGYFVSNESKMIDLEKPGFRNYQSPRLDQFCTIPHSSEQEFVPVYPDNLTGEVPAQAYRMDNFRITGVMKEELENLSGRYPGKVYGLSLLYNKIKSIFEGGNDDLDVSGFTEFSLVMLPSWHQLRDRINSWYDGVETIVNPLDLGEYAPDLSYKPIGSLNKIEYNEELGYSFTRHTNIVSHAFGNHLNMSGLQGLNYFDWISESNPDNFYWWVFTGDIGSENESDFGDNYGNLEYPAGITQEWTSLIYRFAGEGNKNITVGYTGYNEEGDIYNPENWKSFDDNEFLRVHKDVTELEDYYYDTHFLPLQALWKFEHFFKLDITSAYIEEVDPNGHYCDIVLSGTWNGIPLWEGVELEKDSGGNLGFDFPLNSPGKEFFSNCNLGVIYDGYGVDGNTSGLRCLPIVHSYQADENKLFGRKSIYQGSVQTQANFESLIDNLNVDLNIPGQLVPIPNYLILNNLPTFRKLAGVFEFADSNLDDVLYCNSYVGMKATLRQSIFDTTGSDLGNNSWDFHLSYGAFYKDILTSDSEAPGDFYINWFGYAFTTQHIGIPNWHNNVLLINEADNGTDFYNIYINDIDSNFGALKSSENAHYGTTEITTNSLNEDGILESTSENIHDYDFGHNLTYLHDWNPTDEFNNFIFEIWGSATDSVLNLGASAMLNIDIYRASLCQRIDFSGVDEGNFYCYSRGRADLTTEYNTEICYYLGISGIDTDVAQPFIETLMQYNPFVNEYIENNGVNEEYAISLLLPFAKDMLYGAKTWGLYDDESEESFGMQWINWCRNHLGLNIEVVENSWATFSALDGMPIDKAYMKTSYQYWVGANESDADGFTYPFNPSVVGEGYGLDGTSFNTLYYDLLIFNKHGILQTSQGVTHTGDTPIYHIHNPGADQIDGQLIGTTFNDENGLMTDDVWNFNWDGYQYIATNGNSGDNTSLDSLWEDRSITWNDLTVKMNFDNSLGENVTRYLPIMNIGLGVTGTSSSHNFGTTNDYIPLSNKRQINSPSLIMKHLMISELGLEPYMVNNEYNEFSHLDYKKNTADYDYKLGFSLNKITQGKKYLEEIATNTQCLPRFTAAGKFEVTHILNEYNEESVDFTIESRDVRKFKFSTTKADELRKGCKVKYLFDYESEEFKAETNYVSASDLIGDEFSSDYYSYDESDSEEEFEAKFIRDEKSANRLRDFIVYNNCNQHIILDISLPLKYIASEVGDIIRFDKIISETKIFGEDYTKENYRNGQVVYPYFLIIKTQKTTKEIKLKLYQLHKLTNTNLLDVGFDFVEEQILQGDMNQDGIVNVVDIVNAVSIILDTDDPTSSEITYGDMNNDGIINIVDIVSIVNVVLG